jgi:hypothetical protein
MEVIYMEYSASGSLAAGYGCATVTQLGLGDDGHGQRLVIPKAACGEAVMTGGFRPVPLIRHY